MSTCVESEEDAAPCRTDRLPMVTVKRLRVVCDVWKGQAVVCTDLVHAFAIELLGGRFHGTIQLAI